MYSELWAKLLILAILAEVFLNLPKYSIVGPIFGNVTLEEIISHALG